MGFLTEMRTAAGAHASVQTRVIDETASGGLPITAPISSARTVGWGVQPAVGRRARWWSGQRGLFGGKLCARPTGRPRGRVIFWHILVWGVPLSD
jgi:hypothetical protein